MENISYKVSLAILLGVSCLYGSEALRPEKRRVPAVVGEVEVCRIISAPAGEVELCRKIFGLQAECELACPRLYTLAGGVFGACAAIAKCSRDSGLLKYSSKLCGLVTVGSLVGAYVRTILQNKKTSRVIAARAEHYFPQDYVSTLHEKLECRKVGFRNNGSGQRMPVYEHNFKADAGTLRVRESEIKQWHNLASSGHCCICYPCLKSGRLSAYVPHSYNCDKGESTCWVQLTALGKYIRQGYFD